MAVVGAEADAIYGNTLEFKIVTTIGEAELRHPQVTPKPLNEALKPQDILLFS